MIIEEKLLALELILKDINEWREVRLSSSWINANYEMIEE